MTVEQGPIGIRRNEYEIIEQMFSEEQLECIITSLGERISSDYKDKDPVFIFILNGAVVFGVDLMKKAKKAGLSSFAFDSMGISSYPEGTESSKQPIITKDIKMNIKDRHVIIVEDIVDTGWSLAALFKLLDSRGPASVAVCALLNKQERRQIEVPLDYVGAEIPNKFVVGYGLDVEELFRDLLGIFVARKIASTT